MEKMIVILKASLSQLCKTVGDMSLNGKIYFTLYFAFQESSVPKEKTELDENFKIYQNGKEKFEKEMDIRKILESVRTTQSLSKMLLDEEQRVLIDYDIDKVLDPYKLKNAAQYRDKKLSFNEMMNRV
jgi:hypothetical protein